MAAAAVRCALPNSLAEQEKAKEMATNGLYDQWSMLVLYDPKTGDM
jgi:hypothetical protein